ncbi:MAG: PEP-CTERM sorting domain-containing protein [Planctomycetia bacterium]|nr:PEP-CTERM sorting domain-containing protein [Planctomycetia bacterium]
MPTFAMEQNPYDDREPYASYTDGGEFSHQSLINSQFYYKTSEDATSGMLRVGENRDNGIAALYQTAGTVHANSNYPIIGQSTNASATGLHFSLYQLSGSTKAYIVGSGGANGLYMATADYNDAVLEIQENSPDTVLFCSDIRLGSSSGYSSNAHVQQASGTIYATTITTPTAAKAGYEYGYTLSDGNLFAGAITNTPMTFIGGTMAFETSNTSLTNDGGTLEIYGNLASALQKETYTYALFAAGNTPGYTTYGTSTVTGDYVQKNGTLALDYHAGTPTNSDKLAATNIALEGGKVLVRSSLYANHTGLESFDGLDGNITSSATVQASMSGWKWKLDTTTGTLSTDMKTWNPTTQTTIADGDYLTLYSTSKFAGSFNMTGGYLTGRFYMGTDTADFTMNQSGGTTLLNQTSYWAVLLESGTSGRQAIWNLSNDAKFYVFDNQSYNGEDRRMNIGKGYLGKITIADNVVFHADAVGLGVNNGSSYYGRGIVEQSGGEAYYHLLRMYTRKESVGTSDPSSYTLTDGRLVVRKLESYAPDTSATIQPLFQLQGGTATIVESNMSLVNDGSTIQIQSVGDILDDFRYLNDGDETTDRPLGFTNIGTMDVTGTFTQNRGIIEFEIDSETLLDTLNASEGIFLNGGDLFVEYLGEEILAEGTTFAIFGESPSVTFGELFNTLVSNREGTQFWQLNTWGATYVGSEIAVPEPASWLLLVLGLGYFLKRRWA